jgi:Ca-activated chloride channel family protein
VRLDQAEIEQPFGIGVGEAKEVLAVLNAGVLAISAPGAKRIVVFGAKKDIQGNRKDFGYAYDETHQTTLLAGDYVIVAERDGNAVNAEGTATVSAGERTELSMP